MWLAIIIFAWYTLASLATFGVFWFDKQRAVAADGRRRIPEKTLHALSLVGGVPGAWAAMYLARHKNRKPVFVVTTAAITLVHVIAWTLVLVGV